MFITMTKYDQNLPAEVAFPPNVVELPLGKVLSDQGIQQLRMAETEKRGLWDFISMGGMKDLFPSEERIIIPSSKVATYDLKPEMSAYELTETLIKK